MKEEGKWTKEENTYNTIMNHMRLMIITLIKIINIK